MTTRQEFPDSPPNYSLSPGVKAELDRRREEYLRDPSTAVSVDETFDELMNDTRNSTKKLENWKPS